MLTGKLSSYSLATLRILYPLCSQAHLYQDYGLTSAASILSCATFFWQAPFGLCSTLECLIKQTLQREREHLSYSILANPHY